MIYDCFMFFNELELLEIRFSELWHAVDRFVLVESTVTHTNQTKPLYYEENKERFSKFHSKIIHIVVSDNPASLDPLSREIYQRNCIARGIRDCKPDDLILVSDVDEIPNPEVLAGLRTQTGLHVFEQDLFYYYLNCRGGKWQGTLAIHFGEIDTRDIQSLRTGRYTFNGGSLVSNGGWHFSYLGGPKRIAEKLESYSHQEYNKPIFKDERHLLYSMITGADPFGRHYKYEFVETDSMPRTVRDDLVRYAPLLGKNPTGAGGYREEWYSDKQLQSLRLACKSVRFLEGAVVELGCWEGRSTTAIANCCYPDTVLAVDTWAGNLDENPDHPSVIAARERDVFATFATNMKRLTHGNVRPFVMKSTDFLAQARVPVKFCHIDACHDYPSVYADISSVMPLMVEGGVICGDDFQNANINRTDLQGGVEHAVRELLPGFRSAENFWYWRKPKAPGTSISVQRWVKTALLHAACRLPDSILDTRLLKAVMPRPKPFDTESVLRSMS